eukprot:7980257-Pyramimonas_sp.AAC.1
MVFDFGVECDGQLCSSRFGNTSALQQVCVNAFNVLAAPVLASGEGGSHLRVRTCASLRSFPSADRAHLA